MQNQLLAEHIGLGALRHLHQTRQGTAGTSDNAQALLFLVRLFEHGRRIDFLIAQERERLALVHDNRGQQRCNFAVKEALQMSALLLVNGMEVHNAHTGVLQLHHELGENFIFSGVQAMYCRKDALNLLCGRHIGFIVPNFLIRMHLVDVGADAHAEKLVQVALINRQK